MDALPQAHLDSTNQRSRRNSKSDREFPLFEAELPRRAPSQGSSREQLDRILDWLDVEKSERYLPEGKETHCDIYAADLAYLAGVYLPRVWWSKEAANRLQLGEPVVAELGKTVDAANANELHRWLEKHGGGFGWRRAGDLDELQARANEGAVALITALRDPPDQPGHMVVVVPESGGHRAVREGGKVTNALYSESAKQNARYITDAFWMLPRYIDHGFWWHP